jgi:hypothetical protein
MHKLFLSNANGVVNRFQESFLGFQYALLIGLEKSHPMLQVQPFLVVSKKLVRDVRKSNERGVIKLCG